MNEEPKLKSCPFCGSDQISYIERDYIERGQNASTFLAKAEKFLLLSNHHLTC